MKLAQLVPRLHLGDAIGDNAIAIRNLGTRIGYDSRIFFLDCDSEARDQGFFIKDFHAWCDSETTTILHYALPSSLTPLFMSSQGRRFLLYHNITPPHYFSGYPLLQKIARFGREQLQMLKDNCDMAYADSEFNRLELEQMGFSRTGVIPIYVNFDRYSVSSDHVLESMFDDDFATILFVGRIAPNKCQHDLIRLFSIFKHYIHPKSRLVLIGKYDGFEKYYTQLVKLAVKLGIGDLHIPGRVTQQELVTWYRKADLFVSMSEHEGFCVPLLESFFLNVPVMAFAAGAVPDVLQSSGVLFYSKNDLTLLAETMEWLISNQSLRQLILQNQSKRMLEFSESRVAGMWEHALQSTEIGKSHSPR